jgi:SHS2 domain-containing protein
LIRRRTNAELYPPLETGEAEQSRSGRRTIGTQTSFSAFGKRDDVPLLQKTQKASSVNPGYEILEHPADVGIEARGKTLADAFAHAAEGLTFLMFDPDPVVVREWRRIELTASDVDQLLVRWLSEVLYLFDGCGFAAKRFAVHLPTPGSLAATVQGEMFSPSRHTARTDVKAVTYHQLHIQERPEGCMVRVYMDI